MERTPCHCKSIQSGTFETLHRLGRRSLNEHSFQDALKAFFQPIKGEDPRLDFYAMYRREASVYDEDHIIKYDEDLNTTLIFVRRPPLVLATYLTYLCRLACFLPSVLPLLSMSTRSSNPTRTSNQRPFSAQFYSPSITLPPKMKLPSFHLYREALPVRLLLQLDSYMRAS